MDAPESRRVGRYELVAKIGEGGMGVVFRARDSELQRDVAIKFLTFDGGIDPNAFARFRREVQAVARLKHPHIVPVFEAGEADGRPYFVMDLVVGKPLLQVLAAGPLPVRRAMEILLDAADAIQHAHERGVIHRDLKPGNILVDNAGGVFLADFGLSKIGGASTPTLTRTGEVLGTPAYMAPEQARSSATVDERTDVYGLGATLYHLLTGKAPFEGDDPWHILAGVMDADPPPPKKLNPRVHRDVETIVLKAMEKDPARRYRTAGDLADDVRRWLAGESIQARPVTRVERAVRWVRRHKVVTALGAALGVAAFAVAWPLVAPARATIRSDPPGARVFLDDREIGSTPLTTGWIWPPGLHVVRLERDDCETWTDSARLRGGATAAVDATLRRHRGWLTLTTAQDALTVEIQSPDGRHVVSTAAPNESVPLDTGRYRLVVSRENFFPRIVDADVRRDAATPIHLTLTSAERWTRRFPSPTWPLFLADLDADGVLDVGATTSSDLVLLSGRTGDLLGTWSGVRGAAAAHDVDRDGRPDAIVALQSPSIEARTCPEGRVLWSAPVPPDGPVATILVRDLDGRGDPAVVASLRGDAPGLLVLDARTGVERWSARTPGWIYAFAAVADVDGDGTRDLVTADESGAVIALDGVAGHPLWRYDAGARIRRQPVAAAGRVWICDDLLVLHVLSLRDGSLVGRHPGIGTSITAADLDRDGRPEILTGLRDDRLAALDAETLAPRWESDQRLSWSCPVAADVDGDGRLDVVAGAQGIAVISSDGSRTWRYGGVTQVFRQPLVADLDGDGGYEFVVGSDEGVVAAGRCADDGPVWVTATGEPVAIPTPLDVEGDGAREIAVHGPQELLLLDAATGLVRWRSPASSAVGDPMPCGDVDGDGAADLWVTVMDGHVSALSGVDGGELYRVGTKPYAVTSWAVPSGGVGLIGSGDSQTGGRLTAFDRRTGAVRWEVDYPARVNREVAVLGDAVFARAWHVVHAHAVADGAERWTREIADTETSDVCAGDFDADGRAEVVVMDRAGTMHVLDAADGEVAWTLATGAGAWDMEPAVADLDGDGGADLAFGTATGAVFAVSMKARRPLWRAQTSTGGAGRVYESGRCVLHDFDGDGTPDVLIGSGVSRIHVFSGRSGVELARRETDVPMFRFRPAVLDVDGDGRVEILAALPDRRLYALRFRRAGPAEHFWGSQDLRTDAEAAEAAVMMRPVY